MKEIVLIKLGEIALKGLNRYAFEDALKKNIKSALYGIGYFKVSIAQSTIYVTPQSDVDMDEVCDRISRIFGIVSFCRACVCEKTMESIFENAPSYLEDALSFAKTFKVEAKRSDKKFPLKSPEICREVGGLLLEHYPHLTVDVHNPDVKVVVEVRDFGAYIHAGNLKGAGGIPVGTGGNGAILISGGIDSPVAAYMLAKRGVKLTAIHFASPPYTSERAEDKVQRLLKKVCRFAGPITMLTVPFTKIQEKIKDECPEELFTIIMRRMMMKISSVIAEKYECAALITGESLAQVASQTMEAMAVTGAVVDIPIFMPLIGFDKEEIVTIARKIGTMETSILPYEDCCTVFTPKHPKVRPRLEDVEKAQNSFDFEPLIQKAVEETELKIFEYNK